LLGTSMRRMQPSQKDALKISSAGQDVDLSDV
jgi:hypothetical protein